jgi:hypothetical protein
MCRTSPVQWDALLSKRITGDEAWVQAYNPLTKRQSMEWHHQSLPCTKEFKLQTSASKVTAWIFWDSEEILLVEFLERDDTHMHTLKKLKHSIWRVQPNRMMNQVLLLHNNAREHTSLPTIDNCNSQVDCSPSFSQQSRFSAIQPPPLGPLKDLLWGCCSADSKLKYMCDELRCVGKESYTSCIQYLMQWWKKCVDNGDCGKKI